MMIGIRRVNTGQSAINHRIHKCVEITRISTPDILCGFTSSQIQIPKIANLMHLSSALNGGF